MLETPEWGVCPWSEEAGTELLHPEDITAVRSLQPGGKVLKVLEFGGEFVRLGYGDADFRARPGLVQFLRITAYAVGEAVSLADGRAAVIEDVLWHWKRAEPMYFLRVEGKKKSKRYWSADLVSPR